MAEKLRLFKPGSRTLEGQKLIKNRKAREARVVKKKKEAETEFKPMPAAYYARQQELIKKQKKK